MLQDISQHKAILYLQIVHSTIDSNKLVVLAKHDVSRIALGITWIILTQNS